MHREKNCKPVDHILRTHFLPRTEGSTYHSSQRKKKKKKNKLQRGSSK